MRLSVPKDFSFPIINHEDSPDQSADFVTLPDGAGVADLRHAIETLPLDRLNASTKVAAANPLDSRPGRVLRDFPRGSHSSVTSLIQKVEAKQRDARRVVQVQP